jgi:hypothetical protein
MELTGVLRALCAGREQWADMSHNTPLRETARAWYYAAADAAAALVGRLRRRTNRTHLHERIERLAGDIVAIAESIEADLAQLSGGADLTNVARLCTRSKTLAEQSARLRGGTAEVEDVANRLHDEHWRMVNLRSELDALMVRRRDGDSSLRMCKFATGGKPARSRWSSTLSHTSSHAGSHTTRSTLD